MNVKEFAEKYAGKMVCFSQEAYLDFKLQTGIGNKGRVIGYYRENQPFNGFGYIAMDSGEIEGKGVYSEYTQNLISVIPREQCSLNFFWVFIKNFGENVELYKELKPQKAYPDTCKVCSFPCRRNVMCSNTKCKTRKHSKYKSLKARKTNYNYLKCNCGKHLWSASIIYGTTNWNVFCLDGHSSTIQIKDNDAIACSRQNVMYGDVVRVGNMWKAILEV